jgi:hypothetical protein
MLRMSTRRLVRAVTGEESSFPSIIDADLTKIRGNDLCPPASGLNGPTATGFETLG